MPFLESIHHERKEQPMKKCMTCGKPNLNTHFDPPVDSVHDDCTDCSLAAYRARRERDGYSDEEKFAMRANLGDGPIVDALTGKRIL
jgi:hypothetical protein